MKIRTITFDRSRQRHVSTSIENGSTVISQQSIDENGISGCRFVDTEINATSNDTHASSVNKKLIAGPALDNLRIARNYSDASLSRCFRHRVRHHTECFYR